MPDLRFFRGCFLACLIGGALLALALCGVLR